MIQFILGGILIAGGVLISLLVPRAKKNKNIEIKFAQTLPLSELKKQLTDNETAGLSGYRQYAEVKGTADSQNPEKTPYSGRDVAYYKAEYYEVYEETESYRDDTGVHQRTNRTESLVSSQNSYSQLLIKDQSGETAVIELSESGMQFDTDKTLDKFEPLTSMNQYGFWRPPVNTPLGRRVLGYRMREYTIGIGQALYVLGDAILNNGIVTISKPSDKKKPFIVSVKSEDDLVRANETGGIIALVGGIVLAVIGILIMIFVK